MSAESAGTARKPTVARLRAALLDSQRRVLERIATGAPLEEILETLVRLIEEQAGDMRCAVLLADAGQERLRFVAAPNIPEDYRRGIEPHLAIAADMGSCGTAAHLRQPVYTRDTATDPVWENCGNIAVRNGLRAIWSTPILADDNRVLGTFAMYYGEPRLPEDEHIQLIDMAVQLARVAIEAKSDDDLLHSIFDLAPLGLVVTDLAGNIVRANRLLAQRLGHTPAALRGKPIAYLTPDEDHAALVKELIETGREVSSERRYRTSGGELLRAAERTTLRRDTTGKPRYVLSRVERLSETQDDPLAQLSRREREVLELVVAGRSSKQIAARLRIAPASVDTYRSRIMLKLGIEDLPALVRFAIRHGIASV